MEFWRVPEMADLQSGAAQCRPDNSGLGQRRKPRKGREALQSPRFNFASAAKGDSTAASPADESKLAPGLRG